MKSWQLHIKGKIAIRSRYPIDLIATLRRVYTPGVAEVCLKIADDPGSGTPVYQYKSPGCHRHRWICGIRPG